MSFSAWIAGARLRTLPAAFAPVIAGTGVAYFEGSMRLGYAALALAVAVSLQIGVNYANDYSDGIRGTDDNRVGPMRLVGSGAVSPSAVKAAALITLALGAIFGLILAALTSWWLLLIGAAALLAAWGYTGGSRPYGYRALGEVSVFVFFGLIAVAGTAFVQTGDVTRLAIVTGIGVGALACAILVANNLRDIATDREAGKRTLAVVLGDRGTRVFYLALVLVAFATAAIAAGLSTPWALLALLAAPACARAVNTVMNGGHGPALIWVLKISGIAELIFALGLAAGLFIGG